MSWLIPSLSHRLESLRVHRHHDPAPEARVEQIREAMLAALNERGEGRFLELHNRIRHAADAQRMWDLRSDLMRTLANDQGEARAAGKLQLITGMFRDVLPKGLASGLAHPASSGTQPRQAMEPQGNSIQLK